MGNGYKRVHPPANLFAGLTPAEEAERVRMMREAIADIEAMTPQEIADAIADAIGRRPGTPVRIVR